LFVRNNGQLPNQVISKDVAPPIEYFRQIMNDVREGKATCSNAKEKKGTYCCSEAFKVTQQQRWISCRKSAIMRDESAGRLHIRVRTVQKGLSNITSELLGSVKDRGQSAKDVTLGTAKIFKQAFSRFHGAPFTKRKPIWLKKQFQTFRKKLRATAIDSASNEVLSTEMMRKPDLFQPGSSKRLLPNKSLVLRDSAHSGRRVYGRPELADPKLKTVMNRLVTGNKSIARMIHHSRAHSALFHKRVKKQPLFSKSRVRNLRAAKHRLEVLSKPLGRSVLYWQPQIETATIISNGQVGNSEGQATEEWLVNLDHKQMKEKLLC